MENQSGFQCHSQLPVLTRRKARAYDHFWSVPVQIEQFTAFDAIDSPPRLIVLYILRPVVNEEERVWPAENDAAEQDQ